MLIVTLFAKNQLNLAKKNHIKNPTDKPKQIKRKKNPEII